MSDMGRVTMAIPYWIVGQSFFYWTLAVLPALPYILVYLSYRVRLLDKRSTLQNLMSQEGVFAAYQARFGQNEDNRKEKKRKENKQKEDEKEKEHEKKLIRVN